MAKGGIRNVGKSWYFIVEGETEKIYLNRIQQLIHDHPNCQANIKFEIYVDSNIRSVEKRLNILIPTTVFCLFDVEGNTSEDINHFEKILKEMKSGSSIKKNHVQTGIFQSDV